MNYSFTARGHENLLATHSKTLEFTKDKELSRKGDCIVGVSADFSAAKLKQLLGRHSRFVMNICAGRLSDSVEFEGNPDFVSAHELVVRLSDFPSERTFGLRASKAASHLDRRLISRMQDPSCVISVKIEPLVQLIIFDLDNTLVEIARPIILAQQAVAKEMERLYSIYGPTAYKMLVDVDTKYSILGMGSKPSFFDRHLWFGEVLKAAGVRPSAKDIDVLVKRYWEVTNSNAKMMPHARQVLKGLRKHHKLAIMSDSDGERKAKLDRIRLLGIKGLVDHILLSDDVGQNKPNKRFYGLILRRFGVDPARCMMVGDKPQVDLELAHSLGITTVWIKHGKWTEQQDGQTFDYVDHEINDMKQMIDVVRRS